MNTDTPDADPSAPTDDVVRIQATHDKDGIPTAYAVLTPSSDTRDKEIHCDPRTPIPVIFLPGVMGTLLAHKQTGAPLWRAPNIDAVGAAIAGTVAVVADFFQSASARQIRLDPTMAIVDPTGPVKVGESGLSEAEARRRGWSTVHRWSYQPTLAWLEDALNNPMKHGELQGIWAKGDEKGKKAPRDPILGTDPSAYEAYALHGRGEPITEQSEVFKSFASYRYPVYAIGYNFLQSNELSAKDVLDGLDFKDPKSDKVTRIMGIREICRECHTDKAIVITHSMGGLVARMASLFCDGEKDMLGVIHGAQPATGAPLFAKRFRTGGEDFIAKSLLGRNDAEFVAIAANAEGPMELSPMPDYNDGKPWWIFMDNQGNECMRLPKKDALSELYTSDAWYGLLPDSSLLDPAGIVKKRLEEQGLKKTVHQHFKDTIENVVDRQKQLINKYHHSTYAMYGDGTLTSPMPKDKEAAELLTWGTVIWQGNLPEGTTDTDLEEAKLIPKGDNHHGELTITVRGQTVKLTVQKRGFEAKSKQPIHGIVPGDGTVPNLSAQAQGRGLLPDAWGKRQIAQGVQMVFKHGGYEHQFCFGHPWTRWAVLYSVAQIVHSTKGVPVCA